jgi:hypothetical protein
VADYNGDGLDDLIVGTRTGQIRLHKGTKKSIEGKDFVAAMQGNLAPAILEYEGNLKIAGKEIFDKMSSPYPCDWNEDGLVDLILGSTRGKIFIALNTGTKTEPKFETAETIKGTDVETDLLAPANWMNGVVRLLHSTPIAPFCNTASLLTCEKEALRPGAVISDPTAKIRPVPGCGEYFIYYRYVKNYLGRILNSVGHAGSIPGVQMSYVVGGRIIIPKQTVNLGLGKKYELSFYSIVEARHPALWKFWTVEVTPGNDTVPPKHEYRSVSEPIPPSKTWVKRNYTFTCPSVIYTNQLYTFLFRMPEGDCNFYVDGLSLKELP